MKSTSSCSLASENDLRYCIAAFCRYIKLGIPYLYMISEQFIKKIKINGVARITVNCVELSVRIFNLRLCRCHHVIWIKSWLVLEKLFKKLLVTFKL